MRTGHPFLALLVVVCSCGGTVAESNDGGAGNLDGNAGSRDQTAPVDARSETTSQVDARMMSHDAGRPTDAASDIILGKRDAGATDAGAVDSADAGSRFTCGSTWDAADKYCVECDQRSDFHCPQTVQPCGAVMPDPYSACGSATFPPDASCLYCTADGGVAATCMPGGSVELVYGFACPLASGLP
jgi:hypothetical protein